MDSLQSLKNTLALLFRQTCFCFFPGGVDSELLLQTWEGIVVDLWSSNCVQGLDSGESKRCFRTIGALAFFLI